MNLLYIKEAIEEADLLQIEEAIKEADLLQIKASKEINLLRFNYDTTILRIVKVYFSRLKRDRTLTPNPLLIEKFGLERTPQLKKQDTPNSKREIVRRTRKLLESKQVSVAYITKYQKVYTIVEIIEATWKLFRDYSILVPLIPKAALYYPT